MKKNLLLMLLAAMVIIIVVGCGSGSKTVSRHSEFEWPNGELVDLLPVPESKVGQISTNTEDKFIVEIGQTKSKQFEAYVVRCRDNGFTLNSYNTNALYKADNDSGYHLEVLLNSSYDYMTITIKTPINSREFQWPRSEIARLIPTPKSNMGRIEWESSYGFVIYVGNTPKAEYDKYVDSCADSGFAVDYRKGDDFYYADNESGYQLSLRYEGNETMFIRIDEPKGQEDETSPEPFPSESSETPSSEVPSPVAPSPETPSPDVPEQVFSPKDVSDSTIESIQTYDDYLTMYQMIIEDYFANYEAAIKGTALYSAEAFSEMKKTYEDSFSQQRDMYSSMGSTSIIGKDTIIEFLKDYRDSLKEFTDILSNSLS